uniref:Uncharacterized protein n=1 Tax=Streptomyces sp. F12 TaxID=1436084 RepID=V9Z912_9ACTN|nr:hypothetical protein [Streptomyces sp. F12]AHE40494.1 hypothetical protein pFRL6_407c [Streptomyces sp. F12]
MVDRDDTSALVVNVFTPDDVAGDGTVSGSIVASPAARRPGAARTRARMLGAAAHTAALDPQTAVMLTSGLETTASFEEKAQQRRPAHRPGRRPSLRAGPRGWTSPALAAAPGSELTERLTRHILDCTTDHVVDTLVDRSEDQTNDVVAALLAQTRREGEDT